MCDKLTLEIVKKDGFYRYDLIKKYSNNNFEKMGKIFSGISDEKPILVVFGNCQSAYVAHILKHTDVIDSKYNIILFPFIQDMIEERETGLSKEYMKYISVFIYQNVGIKNRFSPQFASQEYVLPLLSEECWKCCIPYVYFEGYTPQFCNARRNIKIDGKEIFPYGDSKIEFFFEHGFSEEKCLAKLRDVNLFSEEEILDNLTLTINELKNREKISDIKISDYIEINFKQKRLFYSPPHPTTELLIVLVNRILRKMGIEEYQINKNGLPENDCFEMFIYPSVKEKLGLSFDCNQFRFSKYVSEEREELTGYVRKYKKYCFPELQEDIYTNLRIIDISHLLQVNTNFVEERAPKRLTISGRQCHMSLYLTLKGTSGTIATLPKNYAPRYNYIGIFGVVGTNGGVYPVTIDVNGNIFTNIGDSKGKIAIIDTIWSF